MLKMVSNSKQSFKVYLFLLLGLGMPHYKEGCKITWSEEDSAQVLKLNQKRDTLALHEHVE
jgi:hypothetical protein